MDVPRVRKVQIGKQKDVEIMQDVYVLSDLEDRTFDFEVCAKCNHRFILPVGMDIQRLLTQNENVRN